MNIDIFVMTMINQSMNFPLMLQKWASIVINTQCALNHYDQLPQSINQKRREQSWTDCQMTAEEFSVQNKS